MSEPVHVESLSKGELKKLLRKGTKRLSSIKRRLDTMDFSDDERVCAIANEILTLAYKTKVPKADVFAAVAGNMRQSLKDVLPPAIPVESEVDAGEESYTADESASAGVAGIGIESPQPPREAQQRSDRKLTLPNGQRGAQNAVTGGAVRREHDKASSKSANEPTDMASEVMYRHPVDAHKTWDGQGAMPKWLRDAVSFGRKLEEFRVDGGARSDR